MVRSALTRLLPLLSLQHFSEPCEATEATEQGQHHDCHPAGAMAENGELLCRRASQEDMGLDDTASQQSASDEQ